MDQRILVAAAQGGPSAPGTLAGDKAGSKSRVYGAEASGCSNRWDAGAIGRPHTQRRCRWRIQIPTYLVSRRRMVGR